MTQNEDTTKRRLIRISKVRVSKAHHRSKGHLWHHKIELKTSIIGPMYVCHCCGEKWFDTIYAVKGLTGKTHYCGDCFEELKILERVKKHLKETGVPEEWL